MRTAAVPFPDVETARSGAADASPWWRSLDGDWDVRFFDRLSEVPGSIVAERGGTWGTIQVPGSWTTQRGVDGSRFVQPRYTNVIMGFDADPPDVPEANPVGVHRRVVDVPASWSGRRVVLRVGAAESVVAAYVNGACVGVGTDSRLPNEFDITEHVQPARPATVVLVVVRWSPATWLEDQDQWWHGGIQRSVSLYSTAPTHLADVKALPGSESGSAGGGGTVTGTLDLELVVDGPGRRTEGFTVETFVETLPRSGAAGRRLATTGALGVPVWRAANEIEELLSGMFVEPGVVRARLDVAKVHPWTHETPEQYRVLTVLRDPDGEVVEVATMCTGFRSVEVTGNELLINGAPVLLHGVNLHEHDPERGRAVPRALTRRDLELMKAHNLNAVRAAHYPHDEHLAELCDELGLYLIDEANVESHGRQTSLCHDPRYAAAIVERVERMVRRDKHHPSIIAWSLGNESGYGAPHDAAAAWVRRYDPTRPLHYEGPLMHDLHAEAPVTDLVCPMYTSIDDIVAWARSGRDLRRPLILCEYSHAMGNSNGSLSDYWDAIESTHGLQGGFIWEWLEHGLRRDGAVGDGPGGRTSWGYGGDFGDTPNDANFICDGLVSADREPHPALREVHHIGRPASVEWADDRHRRLTLRNRRWFTDLSDLRATWELRVDGDVKERGELEVPDVGPRGQIAIPRPCRAPRTPVGAEVHLDVVWSLRRRTAWAPPGHVVGVDQLDLGIIAGRARPPAQPRSRLSVPVPVPESPLPSLSRSSSASADGAVGADHAWDVGDLEWSPTLFRALTDNDGIRLGWMRGHLGNLDRWITRQGLDRCEWDPAPARRRVVDGVARITSSGELRAPGADAPVVVRRRLVEHGDGWVHVTVTMKVPAALSDPPRVGTEWVLPGPLDTVEWFGDGPHESYPDRRASARAGRWASAVDDTYEDYVVPQEHGHRTGVRWVALRSSANARRGTGESGGGRGRGADGAPPALVVVADPSVGDGKVGLAVRRHRDRDLWACSHTDELAQLAASGPAATYLYLDVAQRGLGTASCGPDALERYRIGSGTHTLSVWFRSFVPGAEDPAELAREIRERR